MNDTAEADELEYLRLCQYPSNYGRSTAHLHGDDLSDSPGRFGKEDMHKVYSKPFSLVILFHCGKLWHDGE